jgi:hypothetical protein
MPQTHILTALRTAFPEPQGRIKAYLDAYAALVYAERSDKRAALAANQAAWKALTEGEKTEIDAALRTVKMQVW